MKSFYDFVETKDNTRRCPRCFTLMVKHPDPKKAKEGIRQCPKCFLNYSPNAPHYKGSLAQKTKDNEQ